MKNVEKNLNVNYDANYDNSSAFLQVRISGLIYHTNVLWYEVIKCIKFHSHSVWILAINEILIYCGLKWTMINSCMNENKVK